MLGVYLDEVVGRHWKNNTWTIHQKRFYQRQNYLEFRKAMDKAISFAKSGFGNMCKSPNFDLRICFVLVLLTSFNFSVAD